MEISRFAVWKTIRGNEHEADSFGPGQWNEVSTMMEPERPGRAEQRRAAPTQETGNVVEIENGMDDEARGTDGGPDIGIELQACGNYETRFRRASVNVARTATEIVSSLVCDPLPRNTTRRNFEIISKDHLQTLQRSKKTKQDQQWAIRSGSSSIVSHPSQNRSPTPERNICFAARLRNDSNHTRPELCHEDKREAGGEGGEAAERPISRAPRGGRKTCRGI
ncbi:uncharacterized protein LOC143259508 [Megalopta genalis]|uniref:uncharacterized protein LOC143259508 n=1 Tax=Megalopta genalis TaxID=115081 RepID=UPI003FCFE5B9